MKGNVLSKLKYSSVQYIFIKSMNVYSLILSFDHWHYATDLTRTSRCQRSVNPALSGN
jgi:hypothetical protein